MIMKVIIGLSLLCMTKCSVRNASVSCLKEKERLAPMISMMSTLVDKLYDANTELQKKTIHQDYLIKSILEKVDKNAKKMDQMTTNEGKVQSDVSTLQKEVKSLKRKEKGPVFAATFTNFGFITLQKNEVLKFDNVFLNEGNGYNHITGYFTAPWSGLYHVSCTVRANRGKSLYVYLWKNNLQLLVAYSEDLKTGSLQSAMRVQKGDILYIKHNNSVGQVNGAPSTFSVIYLSD